MFGADFAALMGLFGLTSAFGVIGLALACWMAWRIVEKAGFPGWAGLVTVLLTVTAVGTIVPLVLLWVFAFVRWPRDDDAPRAALPPPGAGKKLPGRPGWRLVGTIPTTGPAAGPATSPTTGPTTGGDISLFVDIATPSYVLTGAPAAQRNELSVPDPSVGQPHARLLVAGARLGLEDLGSPGGTYIDGARLLPEHGPRDITVSRTIRLGRIELTLSKS